ncbi:ice-binding family protein [uncultured Jatrophihabitans sp.]|uniref:ice-binding family protein n=1 Tax=uncultured Jatrophihabitans sp. TaxID=1610747 RepID=UPI0035CC4B09
MAAAVVLNAAGPAEATDRVDLTTAASFAVLAGTSVTNDAVDSTSTTTISGDVGVSPGSSVTGLTPGMVSSGSIHSNDAAAIAAQNGLSDAYAAAAPSTPPAGAETLGGRTIYAGDFGGTTLALTGTVTLDAQGDPNAVFVLQATTSLDIAAAGVVVLAGGAQACHVYWQVGSSATLGAGATLAGSFLADSTITVGAGTTIDGRLLAKSGAVTLIDDTVTRPICAPPTETSTATTSTGPSTDASTASTGSTSTTSTSTGSTTSSSTSTGSASTGSTDSGSTTSGSTTSGSTSTGSASTGTTDAAPVVATIGPASGPSSGGTTVTLHGSGFVAGATTVTVGGVPVPAGDVQVLSPTRLTFVTPAHAVGAVSVVVTTPRGSSGTGLTFRYAGETSLATTGPPDTLVVGGTALALLAAGGLILGLARRPLTAGRHR